MREFVRGRPAAPLRELVAGYSGYREADVPPMRHRGLPSPYLTLIVTLDDLLVMAAHPDPRVPAGSYRTLVGGLHTTPALIVHDGRQSGIQLAVTPAGARGLLGLPAAELAGADLDAADVLPWAAELRDRVRAAGGWPQRFAAVDAVLARHARAGPAVPVELAVAWRQIIASGGAVPAWWLAERIGWTDRYLRRRFRAEFGLGVKQAARVARFDRARRRLARAVTAGRPLSLAAVAAASGYCDQAHLAREFRALAGCPPSAWLADEFRYIQASDAAELPGWRHDGHHSHHPGPDGLAVAAGP